MKFKLPKCPFCGKASCNMLQFALQYLGFIALSIFLLILLVLYIHSKLAGTI